MLELRAKATSLSADQLGCALAVLADELLRRAEDDRAVDPGDRMKARIKRTILRMEATLLAGGERLRQTAQYTALRQPGDPALTTIYDHHGSFAGALAAAGLLGAQPVAALTRGKGRGKGRPDYSTDDCIRALAVAREFFLGRRRSVRDYDNAFRENHPDRHRLPSSETINDHAPKGVGGGPWTYMNDRADELILREPQHFPFSAAVLRGVA